VKGYTGNIEDQTAQNKFFRQVIFTGKYCQLVLMSLKPGEEIGMEVHANVDQFFRFESGEGMVVMDGEKQAVKDGWAAIVPAGTNHNIINTSKTESLQLYTIYSPPNHPDKTVHKTKAEAVAAEH
jgi:mannose-6-phosphate isomerase-like protein (cupin superfamily)